MNTFKIDSLRVMQFDTREEMGAFAAAEAAACVRALAAAQREVNIIFAAAPSQNEFLASLRRQDVPWGQVTAFQMDDYIGIRADAPQRFANFLQNAIFDHVPLGRFEIIDCGAQPCQESARYAGLLRDHPIDIAFIGIGENGHIAFNDPDVADFYDHEDVKKIAMAPASRNQQVNDGCFRSLDEVPREALTVTLPVILRARHVFCVVPGRTKAQAVRDALRGPVSTDCPASVLRLHKSAALYIDGGAAEKL